MNRGNINLNEDMIVAMVIMFHSRLHITAGHQDCPVFTVFLTIKTSSPKCLHNTLTDFSYISRTSRLLEGKCPLNDFGETVPSAEIGMWRHFVAMTTTMSLQP